MTSSNRVYGGGGVISSSKRGLRQTSSVWNGLVPTIIVIGEQKGVDG